MIARYVRILCAQIYIQDEQRARNIWLIVPPASNPENDRPLFTSERLYVQRMLIIPYAQRQKTISTVKFPSAIFTETVPIIRIEPIAKIIPTIQT